MARRDFWHDWRGGDAGVSAPVESAQLVGAVAVNVSYLSPCHVLPLNLSLKCFYYLNRKSKPQDGGRQRMHPSRRNVAMPQVWRRDTPDATEFLIQMANNPAPHVCPCISAVVIRPTVHGTQPPPCVMTTGVENGGRPKFQSLRSTRVTPNSSTAESHDS